MKHFAILAAAGSLAAFAAPAQAADFAATPTTVFASYNQTPFALNTTAAFDDDDDDDDDDYRRDRRYRDRDRDRDRDYYEGGRRLGRRDRVWRGDDGRYYCKRDNGTTGLVVGAIGGALLGRTVDTRGDRTVGTLLGAIGGGLLGREIDRGEARCR